MDVIRLNGANHVLHEGARADVDAARGADVVQALDDGRHALGAAQEPDDADDALVLDGLEALLERCRAADLDHVVRAHAARQFLRRLAPVRVLLVVDHVVGPELLQLLRLLARRRRRDDGGAGCPRELATIFCQFTFEKRGEGSSE